MVRVGDGQFKRVAKYRHRFGKFDPVLGTVDPFFLSVPLEFHPLILAW